MAMPKLMGQSPRYWNETRSLQEQSQRGQAGNHSSAGISSRMTRVVRTVALAGLPVEIQELEAQLSIIEGLWNARSMP